MLAVEACELGREVEPCNLRSNEVELLNAACGALPFRFKSAPSSTAKGKGKGKGRFDHVWIVSVLNDPEKYPELSALSYGRANPVMFDPRSFERERKIVKRLAASCLGKLSIPGLVSTSVEEIPWIIDWCARAGIRYRLEQHTYPAALVGDPVCFIRIG